MIQEQTQSRFVLMGLSPLRVAVFLLAVIWLALVGYVMFPAQLGQLRDHILLPAIPAVIILYAMAFRAWRSSPVAPASRFVSPTTALGCRPSARTTPSACTAAPRAAATAASASRW